VKVEFSRPPVPPAEGGEPEPPEVAATVTWRDGSVLIETEDEGVRDALTKTFRQTPVVTDDAAYRSLGASGDVVVQPGGLSWFMAVAQVRAPAETGLSPRFVPGVTRGGYDPAAGYRRFDETIERLAGTSG
jgi:hypothetical protein